MLKAMAFSTSFQLNLPPQNTDKKIGFSLRAFWGDIAMENIVTAKEIASLLKLSESTIYKLASNGGLPGFKIGDSWRFDIDEILKLIQETIKGNRK